MTHTMEILFNDELIDRCQSGDVDFVEYAIAEGVDIHHIDHDGWSFLFWADARVIPILLRQGLDINHVDCRGRNALRYAACELIRNGCDINNIDDNGTTILEDAFRYNKFKLVEVLLEKGAIGIQTTLYRNIKANDIQLSNLTEQTKDLTMYKSFYKICNFEFCKLLSNASDNQY